MDSNRNQFMKHENPYELLPGKERVSTVIALYFQISQLKQLFRQGWLRDGKISEAKCESVADHCFGMVSLGWFICDQFHLGLDMLKVFKMIIAHEFGEVYGGDITPADGISEVDKYAIEKDSVKRIFGHIPGGQTYVDIWEEFSAKTSKEAVFVAQLDKLEMALQASVYTLEYGCDLSGFMASAESAVHNPILVEILEEVRSLL